MVFDTYSSPFRRTISCLDVRGRRDVMRLPALSVQAPSCVLSTPYVLSTSLASSNVLAAEIARASSSLRRNGCEPALAFALCGLIFSKINHVASGLVARRGRRRAGTSIVHDRTPPSSKSRAAAIFWAAGGGTVAKITPRWRPSRGKRRGGTALVQASDRTWFGTERKRP